MLRVEFTIEPFVEGRPGPHVTAAIDAAGRLGHAVEVGPFGSSCRIDADELPGLLAALGRAAFDNGASHLSVHVDRDGGRTDGEAAP